MRRGIVGRHDKAREAISWTSKGFGNEGALAFRAAFKHWLSDRPNLGFNHYQKKKSTT